MGNGTLLSKATLSRLFCSILKRDLLLKEKICSAILMKDSIIFVDKYEKWVTHHKTYNKTCVTSEDSE